MILNDFDGRNVTITMSRQDFATTVAVILVLESRTGDLTDLAHRYGHIADLVAEEIEKMEEAL